MTDMLPSAASASTHAVDRELLQRYVRDLRPLPQAALRALAALRREDASAADCAEHIEHDSALAARTLRLANSAFYGVPGRVATVRDAINVLGRRTLSGALTTAMVMGQFEDLKGFDFMGFWRHALATAIAAQTLAADTSLDNDLAFTVGLLHDIGGLALASGFPIEVASAAGLAQVRSNTEVWIDAEYQTFGISHAEVGAMIAHHWHFPEAVADAIAHHHALAPERSLLADLVHAADDVAQALERDSGPTPPLPTPSGSFALQRLGLQASNWLCALERTEHAVAAMSEALGVNT